MTNRVEKELSEICARSDHLPRIQFLKIYEIHREVLLAERSLWFLSALIIPNAWQDNFFFWWEAVTSQKSRKCLAKCDHFTAVLSKGACLLKSDCVGRTIYSKGATAWQQTVKLEKFLRWTEFIWELKPQDWDCVACNKKYCPLPQGFLFPTTGQHGFQFC